MAFGIARKTYHQGDRLSASDFNRVSRAARKASLYTTSQGGVQGLESTGTITYAVSKLYTPASTGAVCSLVGIDGKSLYLAKAEEPPFCILLHTAQPNDLVTVATSGGPWLTIVDGSSESIERGDLLSPTEAGLVTKEDGTNFYAVEDEYTSDGIRFVRVTFAAAGKGDPGYDGSTIGSIALGEAADTTSWTRATGPVGNTLSEVRQWRTYYGPSESQILYGYWRTTVYDALGIYSISAETRRVIDTPDQACT